MDTSMSVKTRLFLVRHAVVRENHGKVYGAEDMNCDCSDHAQFAWLAENLPAKSPYVTSALKRTQQTANAAIAKGYSGEHVASFAELNEQCFGAWEGLSYDEIRDQYGASAERFWLAPAGKRPPSTEMKIAESFHDLATRTNKALQQITKDHAGKDVVIFAHGGTIRAALAIAMGLYQPENPDGLSPIFGFKVDNLSLSRLDHVAYTTEAGTADEYWRIGLFNALRTA